MSRSTDSGKLALWRERFSRFSRGEVSVESFCAREQVSVAAFYYWREKVGQAGRPSQDRPRANRPGAFRPVTVVPAGSAVFDAELRRSGLTTEAAAAVRIELPCGTRIEVGTEDLEVLRTVVSVLARSGDGHHGSDGSC
jgi:hypothetical protein